MGSCPLLVKRGSLQSFWRFWVCGEEGQPTPLLGTTFSAPRVSVAILMASPKVGKNQICCQNPLWHTQYPVISWPDWDRHCVFEKQSPGSWPRRRAPHAS